jgi:hypothetical protein
VRTSSSKDARRIPKVSSNSATPRQEAGPVVDLRDELDGYTVTFTALVDDVDATPYMQGLPDDRCQSASGFTSSRAGSPLGTPTVTR